MRIKLTIWRVDKNQRQEAEKYLELAAQNNLVQQLMYHDVHYVVSNVVSSAGITGNSISRCWSLCSISYCCRAAA